MRARLLSLALVATLALPHDTRACSCLGPEFSVIAPESTIAAPRNVHVWLVAPTAAINPQTLTTLVLRPHGGSNIAIQTRTYPQSNVTIIELIPTSPLPASTQFEVSVVTPDAHPPTTVAATFKTAANSDMAPPQFAGIGHQSTHLNPAAAGSAC